MISFLQNEKKSVKYHILLQQVFINKDYLLQSSAA
jgi:hypothetical protein